VRVRRYAEKYSEDEVETFLDRCMSVDDLIDLHLPGIKRREDVSRYDFKETEEETDKLTRFQSKDYMSDYINPPEALKAEEEELKKKQQAIERSFPERPEKDVLLFLIEYAPLKPWQRDVLSIVRDEAYYYGRRYTTANSDSGSTIGQSLMIAKRSTSGRDAASRSRDRQRTVCCSPTRPGVGSMR
jgi:spore cortex formation protein SpoVR/YcgB (stage V sporulation)